MMFVVAWDDDGEEKFVRHTDTNEVYGWRTREEAERISEELNAHADVDSYVIELKQVLH